MQVDKEDGKKPKKTIKKTRSLKVVVRRLPPAITWSELEEQLAPLPPHDFIDFVPPNPVLAPHSFARVYIGFEQESDVLAFAARFNEYLFVDSQGNESFGVVEFAPFSKIPTVHKEEVGKDNKIATIESEPSFLQFVAKLEAGNGSIMTVEEQLAEVEKKEAAANALAYRETPLTQYFTEKMRPIVKESKGRRREVRPEKKKEELKVKARRGEKERERERATERDRDEQTEEHPKPRVAQRVEDAPITSERVKELFRNARDAEREDKKKTREEKPKGDNAHKKTGRPERAIYQPGSRKKQPGRVEEGQ